MKYFILAVFEYALTVTGNSKSQLRKPSVCEKKSHISEIKLQQLYKRNIFVSFVRYLKDYHFIIKSYQILHICDILILQKKKLMICLKKWQFVNEMLGKLYVNVEKMKISETIKQRFSRTVYRNLKVCIICIFNHYVVFYVYYAHQ